MKNHTTPRTLADCEFTTGHPVSHFHRAERRAHRWMYALIVIAAVAAVYWGA